MAACTTTSGTARSTRGRSRTPTSCRTLRRTSTERRLAAFFRPRTFFFGSFEGLRSTQGQSMMMTVPASRLAVASQRGLTPRRTIGIAQRLEAGDQKYAMTAAAFSGRNATAARSIGVFSGCAACVERTQPPHPRSRPAPSSSARGSALRRSRTGAPRGTIVLPRKGSHRARCW